MNKVWPVVKDFAERALWSAGQQVATVVLAATTVTKVVGFPWQAALATGAGAGIVSLLLTGLQYLGGLTNLNRGEDIALRAVKQFIASLLGTIAVGGTVVDVLHVDWGDSFQLAAVAALLSIAKGFLAGGVDASTLEVSPPSSEHGPAVGKHEE